MIKRVRKSSRELEPLKVRDLEKMRNADLQRLIRRATRIQETRKMKPKIFLSDKVAKRNLLKLFRMTRPGALAALERWRDTKYKW